MLTKMELFSASPSAPELPLGGFMPNDDPIQIRNVEGLGPVNAEITTARFASNRGELYQGASVGKRNIVVTLGYNPDWAGDQTIANLRQRLYRYFMPPDWVKMRFLTDELPIVDIEGYVESMSPNIFSQDPEVQVSIICPKPDFIDANATTLTGIVYPSAFVGDIAEYEFDYVGTVSTGFELKVESAPANVAYNGSFTVTVMSPETPKVFTVTPVVVDASKYFKLSTVRNAKRAQTVAVDTGNVTNLLRGVTPESVWAELEPGTNVITVRSAEQGQAWTLAYFNRFGGL